MPVGSDFQWRKSANMAVSLSVTAIGGAMAATAVTDALLGDVFFRMTAPASGGSALLQHQKLFLFLSGSADGPIIDARAWIENALDDLAAASKIRASCSAAETASTKKLRAAGKNSAGSAVIEEKVMPSSAGDLDWSTDWLRVDRVEARLVSNDAYTTVTGAVAMKLEPTASPGSGYTTFGTIPANKRGASAEYQIWAEATLDSTSTNGTGNACTVAPSGSSFSKPRTSTSGLLVANSGQINTGTAAPVWVLWTLQPEAKQGQPLCCLRVTGGV